MTQKIGVLGGKNKVKDYQFQQSATSSLTEGVISGLELVGDTVSIGSAFISIQRTGGATFLVNFYNTEDVVLTMANNSKIFIEVEQENIDSGDLNNNVDGTGIASIKIAAAFPTKNFIPIAETDGSGNITDLRKIINLKSISGTLETETTLKIQNANGDVQKINALEILINGIGFNAALGLVKLGADGKIPIELLGSIETAKSIANTYIAGEDLLKGDIVYFDTSTNKVKKCVNNNYLGIALENANLDNGVNILVFGYFDYTTDRVGATLYLDNAGLITLNRAETEIGYIFNTNKAFLKLSNNIGGTMRSLGLDTNLLAYYNFDENVLDITGNGNDGTVNGGLTYEDGILGKSIKGNGSDAFVDLGINPFTEITNQFTINLWINYEVLPTDGVDYYIGFANSGSSTDFKNTGIGLKYYLETQEIKFSTGKGLSNDSNTQSGITGMTIPENQNIMLTLSMNDTEVKIYKNAELVQTFTIVSGDILWNTEDYANGHHGIGSNYSSGWGNFFRNKIDETGIWNSVLSIDDIAKLYNNGTGLQY